MEDVGDVLQSVDDRVGGGVFGKDKGRGILKELGRQRMVSVAGGRVMLTRNALGTRLS